MVIQNNFLVLGNGRWQQDTLARLHESKLVNLILVVDPFYKPVESNKIRYAALDLNEYEEILDLAKVMKIRYVVCDTSEYGMETAARLRDALNSPGSGLKVTAFFTNKFMMRQMAEDLIEMPFEYAMIQDTDDFKRLNFLGNRSYILKPLKSYASKGVRKFLTLEEGISSYSLNSELGFSTNIVEEFIEGTEFTLESKVIDSNVIPIAMSTKTRSQENFAVATSLLFEPITKLGAGHKLMELNSNFIRSSGLESGITHGEYIVDSQGQVNLVEIAARGGGTEIYSKMLRALTGFDAIGHYLESISNLDFELPPVQSCWNIALLGFFSFSEGVLQEVNLEEIRFNWLLSIGLNAQIGDVLQPPIDDNQRHGYFWILGNALDQVKQNVEVLMEEIVGVVSGIEVKPSIMFDPKTLIPPSQALN